MITSNSGLKALATWFQPCSSLSSNSIFADPTAKPKMVKKAGKGPGKFSLTPSGTYADPYYNLSQVENRLNSDSSILQVCLSGSFTEDLSLSSVAMSQLSITSYKGGATINANGASYAISSGYGSLSDLTISNLEINGFGYAGVNLSDIDEISIADTTIEATGASYGISLYDNENVTVESVVIQGESYAAISSNNNDSVTLKDLTLDATGASYGVTSSDDGEVFIENVEISNSSYTGISVSDADDFQLSDSSIANPGSYAVTVEATDISIESSSLEGYAYSGIDAEGETVVIEKNSLSGNGAVNAVSLVSENQGLLMNNFVIGHATAGFDVGESETYVTIINNSFSDNGEALRFDAGGPHSLSVYSYNNIFYSLADQMAYEPNGYDPNPPDESEQFTVSTSPSTDDNPDVVLYSDYNLFDGSVTVEDGNDIDFSTWQGWGYDSHSKEGDPLFVSTTDLHIQSGSPAINAGYSPWYVQDDIDNQSRASPYDIGADEKPSGYVVIRTGKDVPLEKAGRLFESLMRASISN